MILFTLLLAFCSGGARAADGDPRPEMHALATEISALESFLVSDAEFAAPKNEGAVKKSLHSLEDHLGKLGEGSFGGDPALRANLAMLRQHIQDASRAYNEGARPYARYMVQSSLQMCIACHTRKKAAEFSWPDPAGQDLRPLDRADYFFATRQFEKGKGVYEGLVEGFPKNGIGPWAAEKSLLALAVYYARVKEDPAAGAAYFSAVAKREGLPVFLREELEGWAEEFRAWSREKPAPADASAADLLARAKKLLRRDDFTLATGRGRSFHVRRLRASSLLHRAMEKKDAAPAVKAESLLLLGQIYARLDSSLFFRFGDMYLKACITEYPKTKTARACYAALEGLVFEGYSGSAGTDVPEAEQVELMRLKRLAY